MVVSDADSVSWSDLPGDAEQLRDYLFQKIKAAQEARKATFKSCSTCQKSTPPEWMHDDSTCQTCASNKLGTVY